MKRLYRYRLPLKNGSNREGLILQINSGYGDIAPLPGFSKETLDEAMEEAVRLLPQFPHALPTLPSVQFALFCALKPFPKIGSIRANSLDTHKSGFESIKLKVGSLSLHEAIERIRQIPRRIKIRLDFNRRWPLDRLLALASHYSPDDFEYWEEPASSFSDLLSLSKMTEFPLAVDESIPTTPYWEIPTLKALVVKPTLLGHVPSPPSGVDLIFSSAYESGIGAIHLASLASQHSPQCAHGLDPYSHLTEDLLAERPSLNKGIFQWNLTDTKLEHPSLCLIASKE